MFLHAESLYCLWSSESLGGTSVGLLRFDLALEEWSHVSVQGEAPWLPSWPKAEYVENHNFWVWFCEDKNHFFRNVVTILDMAKRNWLEPVVKGTPPSYFHDSCVYRGIVDYYNNERDDHSFMPHTAIYTLTLGHGNVATLAKIQFQVPRCRFTFDDSLVPVERRILILRSEGIKKYCAELFDPATNTLMIKDVDCAPPGFYEWKNGRLFFETEDGCTWGLLCHFKVEYYLCISLEK